MACERWETEEARTVPLNAVTARGRFAFAVANVRRPLLSVFFRRDGFERSAGALRLGEDLLQEGHTPTASCPRATAFGELARHFRMTAAYEVFQFTSRHSKAEADTIIRGHD